MNYHTHCHWMLALRIVFCIWLCGLASETVASADNRPNILFCLSDDQSYAHAGANGDPIVRTPAFDRVAREGVRFVNAFCATDRNLEHHSAILTGQHIWRLKEAGNIHSTLPAEFATYVSMLAFPDKM